MNKSLHRGKGCRGGVGIKDLLLRGLIWYSKGVEWPPQRLPREAVGVGKTGGCRPRQDTTGIESVGRRGRCRLPSQAVGVGRKVDDVLWDWGELLPCASSGVGDAGGTYSSSSSSGVLQLSVRSEEPLPLRLSSPPSFSSVPMLLSPSVSLVWTSLWSFCRSSWSFDESPSEVAWGPCRKDSSASLVRTTQAPRPTDPGDEEHEGVFPVQGNLKWGSFPFLETLRKKAARRGPTIQWRKKIRDDDGLTDAWPAVAFWLTAGYQIQQKEDIGRVWACLDGVTSYLWEWPKCKMAYSQKRISFKLLEKLIDYPQWVRL